MTFPETPTCKDGKICHECRRNPDFRRAMANRFGPFTCPAGHKFTEADGPVVKPAPGARKPCSGCRGGL